MFLEASTTAGVGDKTMDRPNSDVVRRSLGVSSRQAESAQSSTCYSMFDLVRCSRHVTFGAPALRRAQERRPSISSFVATTLIIVVAKLVLFTKWLFF